MRFLMLAAFAAILYALKLFALAVVGIGGPEAGLAIILICVAIAHIIEPTAARRAPPAPTTAERDY